MAPAPGDITVIIPTYNGSRFIVEAIVSALRQSVPAEVIVVNDGSTDDTREIVLGFGAAVRYLEQANGGVAAARNRALGEATGRYVALLDHDDVCGEDRLLRQREALRGHPGASACFTGHWTFDGGGRTRVIPGNPTSARLGPVEHLSEFQVFGPTVMFDRARAGDARFPAEAWPADDHAFAAILRTRGEFVILPDPLYGYRHWAGQASKNTELSAGGAFRRRLDWALAHRQDYWPDLTPEDVERLMWRGLARQVSANYWARNREYFLLDREFLRRNWPSHLPCPAERDLRWLPGWLWWFRSRLGDLRHCLADLAAGRPGGGVHATTRRDPYGEGAGSASDG
jgi:glycosyltransferase involved in cell wall biosynthesis